MEHIAAIMLLVGCSHGSLACEELQAPQVAFESMEECVGALPAALGRTKASGRFVLGRCAAVDPAWVEEDVELSWHVSPKRGLVIDIRQSSPPVGDVVVADAVSPAGVRARMH